MIKSIFDTLIIDFQKITTNNGFNFDVKEVTTKALTFDKLNYGNTPAVELFLISDRITPYESINYHTLEIGCVVYMFIDTSLGRENRAFDSIARMIEDIENLLKFDLELYRVEGVEKIYLSEIMPFTNDEENQAVLFLKLILNYVN